MPHFIGSIWFAPRLKLFQETNPNIKLTLLFDNRVFNLSMREADAAIRLYEPNQQDLIQRHLTSLNFSLCASKKYLAQHEAPQTSKDLRQHMLIGHPRNSISPFPDPGWIFKAAGIDQDDSRYQTICLNSIFGTAQAVTTGVGIAVLPDFMIHNNPQLESIPFEKTRPPVDMFFVYPEEHKNSKRLALLRDFLLKNIDDEELNTRI